MKYALIINRIEAELSFYTERMLVKLMEINGHIRVDVQDADFILVSLCDVTEISLLKKTREEYPDKKIIVGGHLGVFFRLLILFSDYVVVGQSFEFFKAQSEDEIKSLKCVYYKGKTEVTEPSTLIEWAKVPAVQTSVKNYYYWAGVGCKNKCSFCLTSWTNKPQGNSTARIQHVYNAISTKKHCSIKLIENEGSSSNNLLREHVKDMLLKDFIKSPPFETRILRIGLEFATEENRRKCGKAFTNKELMTAIAKAKEERIIVQFFCIGGLDTRQDWYDLIDSVPEDYDRSPKLIFKFTNLEYEMFTPMWKRRHELDISRYLDREFVENMYWTSPAGKMKRMKILPVKYPAHALWRTGMSASMTEEQFNLFWDLRKNKELTTLHSALLTSKVLDNDYSKEVRFWYQKGEVENG